MSNILWSTKVLSKEFHPPSYGHEALRLACHFFCFLISDTNLRELCGGESFFLHKSQPIVSMTKTECDLELGDFEVFLESRSEVDSILV